MGIEEDNPIVVIDCTDTLNLRALSLVFGLRVIRVRSVDEALMFNCITNAKVLVVPVDMPDLHRVTPNFRNACGFVSIFYTDDNYDRAMDLAQSVSGVPVNLKPWSGYDFYQALQREYADYKAGISYWKRR